MTWRIFGHICLGYPFVGQCGISVVYWLPWMYVKVWFLLPNTLTETSRSLILLHEKLEIAFDPCDFLYLYWPLEGRSERLRYPPPPSKWRPSWPCDLIKNVRVDSNPSAQKLTLHCVCYFHLTLYLMGLVVFRFSGYFVIPIKDIHFYISLFDWV